MAASGYSRRQEQPTERETNRTEVRYWGRDPPTAGLQSGSAACPRPRENARLFVDPDGDERLFGQAAEEVALGAHRRRARADDDEVVVLHEDRAGRSRRIDLPQVEDDPDLFELLLEHLGGIDAGVARRADLRLELRPGREARVLEQLLR